MDNRPIGFFDSGLGGLTCVTHLMNELPSEKVVYFGDTARTPYGSKAENTIMNFSRSISDFLVSNDVKMIVIACNTVSAICLKDLQERHKDIPVIGIIEPTARYICDNYGAKDNIGVIGTKVTVASHSYKKQVKAIRPEMKISELACPVFVPLIEEGIIEDEMMDLAIKHYLDDFVGSGITSLVLGCTHYPLIQKSIKRLYEGIDVINPSKIILTSIKEELERRDAYAQEKEDKSKIEHLFYASDLSDNFTAMIDLIFSGTNIKVAFNDPAYE